MPSPDGTGGFRSKLRSIESAAVAGIVYSGLAVWAMSVLSQRPDLGLSDAELTEWFTNTDFVLGLNLAAISSIAFLWFVAVVRRRIGDQEDRFFSTVFIASATLYLAVWLVGISLLAAPAIALNFQPDGRITQGTETLAVGSGAALILVVAPRFQALFVIITSPLIAARPNIVLVMADDQGWGQTGYYNHPILKTPNLDAMAAVASETSPSTRRARRVMSSRLPIGVATR